MKSAAEFAQSMKGLSLPAAMKNMAVGVSGGPDSMALLHLLADWAEERGVRIFAYTVDHALRPESADEARQVGAWISAQWPQVRHRILRWDEGKPESRILEEARAARYALIASAMKEEGCAHLFVAHHQDDQAETFLFRLAKGSGLDGLAGMAPRHARDGIEIVRPLLDFSKEELIHLCDGNQIPYVSDPTNGNEKYLRPRLRAARDVLEAEGLSAKRLALTAARLARAKDALQSLSAALFDAAVKERRADGWLFNLNTLRASHEELVLRAVLSAMDQIHPEDSYGPRMEKAEALVSRILHDDDFKGATLGRCIFAIDARHATLWIGKEF